ncbi:ABC-type transport system involved in multi-copper enzyme maturation permease subunit [Nonlabens dokdonensis]|uniref:Excinuclease ABC subunit B n=2 Tax=Nonlabens dokdonensis TaxID=328515 RepID=L7WD12_NONDD|nr:ABC transporter permease subunit [Nonlabens dokdonensis]AGC77791.1 excinuclease ABC subunit B [Nonlabens dokdonensis DSW-6]PZX39675.1 ABC-type transport system involved in multi-copper enzyme maturation permease subunit [Nonlabens dokdonensis]
MKRLLDIEFHKFRYSKSSKVLTIIYLVIVVLLMLSGMIRISFNQFSGSLSDLGIFNFPLIWHISTYFTSFLKIFIAIVIVSLTANEYSNRTLKQNLIDGLSKKELILSKFYLATSLAILTTVVVFVASLILGLIYSDFNEPGIIFSQMGYLGAFFLAHLVFFCFCLFAGILVKRSAFALGFVFVWYIFEGILNLIARGIDAFYDTTIYEWLLHILPLNAMSNLIKQPFTKIELVQSTMKQLPMDGIQFGYDIEWLDVVSVCIWSSLFIYWSYRLLKSRDL